MASTSTVETNSASNWFQQPPIGFNDETVKSFPCFRGESVDCLYINDTDIDYEKYTSYLTLINRPYKTTPYSLLDVEMDCRVSPDVLLSKMDEKRYSQLTLGGEYTWRQVVTFLHEGVEIAELFGTMDLPHTNMTEFFKILKSFNIKKISFFPKNKNKEWTEAALKAWNAVVGFDLGPWVFDEEKGETLKVSIGNRVLDIYYDDRQEDNFVDDNFGNEIDDGIWVDDDVEAGDDEEMDNDEQMDEDVQMD